MLCKLKSFTLFLASALLLAACTSEQDGGEVVPEAQQEPAQETEQELIARALEIHDRVLTVDTHADTPLRMIEPGFDMAERHDPYETGSKVDYPRMKEGGLDAIFFAAFVAQDIRDDDGNSRAKALTMQMIEAVRASTANNADIVGLALDPEDAYELENAGKRAIYLGIENGYPVGDDLSNVELYYDQGVRYITLVHSTNNDLADSATDTNGPGARRHQRFW